jgi:hypothetical protein
MEGIAPTNDLSERRLSEPQHNRAAPAGGEVREKFTQRRFL